MLVLVRDWMLIPPLFVCAHDGMCVNKPGSWNLVTL